MRLLSGSVMTRKDHRVADAWPGRWTGISINATRVTSDHAGKLCAGRLAAKARELCDFPVIVVFDAPPYVHPVEGQPGVYDAPQHISCMWPADADPHRLLEVVVPTLKEPTSEYGFVHHYFEYLDWEHGLGDLVHAADRQSDIYRVNWR